MKMLLVQTHHQISCKKRRKKYLKGYLILPFHVRARVDKNNLWFKEVLNLQDAEVEKEEDMDIEEGETDDTNK